MLFCDAHRQEEITNYIVITNYENKNVQLSFFYSKTFMFCICEIQQDVSKWFKACQILLLHICTLYKIMSNYVYAGCSAMHL